MKTDFEYFKLTMEIFVTLVQRNKERKQREIDAGWPEEYGGDLEALKAASHLFREEGFKDFVRRNLFIEEPPACSRIIPPLRLENFK